MGTVDTHLSAGRRFSRTRVAASSAVVAATALAAVFAGSSGNAQAAPSFTNPTFNMNIGKAGGAFVYPFGMAWDPTVSDSTGTEPGSLLVDDYNNYNVKRFGSDGTYMTTYGSKGGKTGQFSEQPSEIAVNPNDGSYVVAFAFNGYGYMKFSSNGTFLYKVTNPVAYYAPFIAVNPQTPLAGGTASGEVYLVQSTGLSKSSPNIVLRYNANGTPMSPAQFGTNGTNCAKGQFGVIRGIDVDNFGNVFVNDVSNHCIQVFSSTGVFEGSFGNKTELSANTRGMKLDRTNDVVYVADAAKEDVAAFNFTYTGTHTVTTGTFAGYIGTSELSQGGTCSGNGVLDAPRDIAVGPDGTVYVSDYACWEIDVFHPLFDTTDGAGVWANQFPNPSIPAPLGQFNGPNGVAVSQDGSTVYVADTFNQRIQEFNGPSSTTGTPGTPVQQWGSRLPNLDGAFSMDYPRGVAIDPTDGSVWVSDTRSGYIKQYTTTNSPPSAPTVTFDQDFGGEGIAPGQFFYSDGITAAAGPLGSIGTLFNPTTLYIPDSGIGYFQVMQDLPNSTQTALVWQTVAEFPCGILVEPDVFNGCTGSAVDALGNIYAADYNEGTVQEFTPTVDSSGIPSYTLTQTINLPGDKPLGGPYGVAISGNTMYVTQSTKNSVSAFDITVPAAAAYLGTWGTKGTGNGQLNRPLGIAVDGAGDVYVDDYGNGRIVVFNPPAL
jgi:tripartite motif-containing protein 71